MQLSFETEYFWRKPKVSPGGRFNLLLLEYGEIFYENLSVYQYPVPNSSLKFVECDTLKVKGRLHLCSRSIIFEPNNIKKPLLKFPYKLLTSDVEHFRLQTEESAQCSVTTSGFSTFKCSGFFELKDNDQVGPYKYIDCSLNHEQSDSGKGLCSESRFVFALVHTDIEAFFATIRRLRDELNKTSRGEGLISLRKQHPSQQSSQSLLFDSSQLVDFKEQLLFSEPLHAVRVGPLVLHPGGLMLTETRFYFQPSHLNNIGDSVQHFDIDKIKRIYSRRYLLRQTGLEIFFADGHSSSKGSEESGENGVSLRSVYFVFESTQMRDHVVATIMGLPSFPLRGTDNKGGLDKDSSIECMTRRWQSKELSNFDYLLLLNSEADRSFGDLTQYPVMPHIIADYRSRKLDLTKRETFRDLSKPVGALNPQRLAFFKERYDSMSSVATEAEDGTIPFPPPFLYGTHYSTPGYVLYYLIRVAPEHMLCLQNGKFDAADRMFYSVAGMFASCLSNPADLKELIPEFFQGEGEFLSNTECLNLGKRHNGERVDDVELPPWAKNPKDFVKKSRQALESDYVSAHLHLWIDLIFGYKQRGAAALHADNLFYYLTYEGSLDLDSDQSPLSSEAVTGGKSGQNKMEREAIDVQIQEFGQTPKQLFYKPHPSRGEESFSNSISSLKRNLQSTAIHYSRNGDINAQDTKTSKQLDRQTIAAVSDKLDGKPRLEGVFASHALGSEGILSPFKSKEIKGLSVISSQIGDPTGSAVKENSTIPQVMLNSSKKYSSGTTSGTPISYPVVPSLLVPTAMPDNDIDKSPAGGFILLGDDFRAEVTRELQSQQNGLSSGAVSPSAGLPPGALVIKMKDSSSREIKSSVDDHIRPSKTGSESDSGVPGEVFTDRKGDSGCSLPPAPQSGLLLKDRMQSLWGSISEKTISLIRSEKSQDKAKAATSPQAPSFSSLQSAPSVKSYADRLSSLSVSEAPSSSMKLAGSNLGVDGDLSSVPTDVAVQLCRIHQLPSRQPITGISALQTISSDDSGRIIICVTSKDSHVSIFDAATLRIQSRREVGIRAGESNGNGSEIKEETESVNGWRTIEEHLNKSIAPDREAKSVGDPLDLLASFVAGSTQATLSEQSAATTAAASMFSPLVLIPQILSSTFAAHSSLSVSFNSSCRLSSDASRVLISSQRGQDCFLYSYYVSDASLSEQNCIRVDGNSPNLQNYNSCVTIGRGSQCMVSGSEDGTVRLWSLSLQTPVTAPPTYGYSAAQLRASLSPKRNEIKQVAIVEFRDVQSPIMCVNLTVFDGYSSSSSSKISGILVAAGSMDGTVMVWTVDLAEQGGVMKAVSQSLLFCHQLRPSERSVVCVEWIPESTEGSKKRQFKSTGEHDSERLKFVQRSKLMLLTGATDGCLHCVDCNGRVLAICEVLSNIEGSRGDSDTGGGDLGPKRHLNQSIQLKSLALTQSSECSSSSSSLVFCGFSDGSIHIISLTRRTVVISTATAASCQSGVSSIAPHKQDNDSSSVKGVGRNGGVEMEETEREGITLRELTQMKVVMIIPGSSFNLRSSAIIAISWLAPLRKQAPSHDAEIASFNSISKALLAVNGSSQPQIYADTSSQAPSVIEMGTLISGDEEGCLRCFGLTFIPCVHPAST